MHEYSIVASLVDRAQREADARPGAVIKKLQVQIGELAGVEVDLLRTAFYTFRERSVCEQAELAIEPVPAEWRCAVCDRVLEPGAILRCCGRPAKLASGGDIILERIEMEVRDV